MLRTVKTNLGDMIKKVAISKANLNCIGFMYEPKKPKKLVQEDACKKIVNWNGYIKLEVNV